VTGVRKGEELTLSDGKLIETGKPTGSGWLTHRTFRGKITKEGMIAGVWIDPTEVVAGTGTFFIVRMDYHLVIQRNKEQADGLVVGTLFLNGSEQGAVTENAEKLIPAGTYHGKVRMTSDQRIVQSAGGRLGLKGDFLLEIADVPGRSDILFHPNSKLKCPEGCVRAGVADSGARGIFAAKDSVAAKLRLHFYGTDTPNLVRDAALYMAKEKTIKIEVRDIEEKSLQPKEP
jgi:hypothetical protein